MMNNNLVLIDKNIKSLNVCYLGFLAKYGNMQTQKICHHVISKFLRFLQEKNIAFDQVNQSIINIYINELRKSMSNSTVNQNLSLLCSFFKHLGRTDLEFKRSRVVPYENCKSLSMDFFNNMLNYLDQKKNISSNKQWLWIRDWLLFNTLFLTGNRVSCILNLRYKDIFKSSDGQWQYITTVKGNYQTTRLFVENLIPTVMLLKEIKKASDDDYIFCSNYRGKHRLNNISANRIFTRHYQTANNLSDQKVHVHQIRSLSGFMYFKQTSDILKVKNFLLHRSLATTDIYLSKLQEKEVAAHKDLEKCLTKNSASSEV